MSAYSLGAVADDDGRGVLLAVAHVAELDGGSDLAGGDVGDQLVAVLDVLAVDGDDDVAGLNASLGGAAVRGDGVDQHAAVGEAVDAADRGGLRRLWKLMPMEPRTTLCSGPMSML